MSAPKVGDQVDSRYELRRHLGDSRTSLRFEAAHRFTGRHVVVEFLRGWEEVPEAEVRLTCGAFALGRVRHPYLQEVSDAGIALGLPFIVTSLLVGRSLEGLLAARGAFTAAETATLGRQLALAVDALHQSGLAHGDLGPANVWVVRSPLGDEQVELRNLHLAYASLAPGPAIAPSRPGAFARASGPGGRAAGVSSDLAALGALLYECLAGASPALEAERLGAPAAPPVASLRGGTPPRLARAVERCFAAAGPDRVHDAHELAASLEATGLAGAATRFLVGTSQRSLRAVSGPEAAPRREPPAPVAAPAEAAGFARRKVPRAVYSTPVRLLGAHGVSDGRIEDISVRGVLVIAASALEIGSVVQLRFAAPGHAALVQCAAVVRWVRVAAASRRAALGFEFQATPPELRSAVEAYVAQQRCVPDGE